MFKKVLIGLDGSRSSLNALEYAIHIAKQEKAELKIITAAEPLPPLAGDGAPSYLPEYQEDLLKSLEKMQKTQVEEIKKTLPDLKVTAEVKEGRAAHVIKEAAEEADLIIIGHRGRGGLLSWVLGSVAKQVVDECTAPVLVVKDKDYC